MRGLSRQATWMNGRASENEELLRLRGVTARLGGRNVVDGVDFAVRKGEIVTLIGPNGAGKTTLARVALGLLAPAAGRVWRRPGLRVGYMPQNMTIDPTFPLSVRRFLSLTGAVTGPRIAAVLAEVGAALVVDRQVGQISGGEWRRVQLARALLREPDLLVLDEPMQGVDIGGQRELYALLAQIRDRKRVSLLLVSHDLHLVMAATDRVVCINGHVCCEGHPAAVARHPEYLALFGAQESDALAVYRHSHDHVHDADGAVVPLAPEHTHDHRDPARR